MRDAKIHVGWQIRAQVHNSVWLLTPCQQERLHVPVPKDLYSEVMANASKLKYGLNATKTLIVESLKFVAKVTVWMLANKNNVESMQNVNTLYMMLDVNVFQALLVMRLESAFHLLFRHHRRLQWAVLRTMIVPCIQLAVTLNVSTHVLISHVEDTLAVASSTIGRNALVLTGSSEMRLLAANFVSHVIFVYKHFVMSTSACIGLA
jgi:hypothetical protein